MASWNKGWSLWVNTGIGKLLCLTPPYSTSYLFLFYSTVSQLFLNSPGSSSGKLVTSVLETSMGYEVTIVIDMVMSHVFSSHIPDSYNPENTSLWHGVTICLCHVVKYKTLNFKSFILKYININRNKFKVISVIRYLALKCWLSLRAKGWCGGIAVTP